MLLRSLALITLSGTSLVACVTHDSAPSIFVGRDSGGLDVTLSRGPGDTFGDVTGSLNGSDMGAPTITEPGQQAEDPATATFALTQGQVPGALDVAIDEDSDHFHVVSSTYGLPRTVTVANALDKPIALTDVIEASTDFATDTLRGSIALADDHGRPCMIGLPKDFQRQGSLTFAFAGKWECDVPADGAPVHAVLSVDLMPLAKVDTCDGPTGTTCSGFETPAVHFEQPVEVAL